MLLNRKDIPWSGQNLDNSIPGISQKEVMRVLNAHMTLLTYIDAWMNTFKKRTLKPSSYSRLATSAKALSDYPIAQRQVGDISFFDVQDYINQLADDGYAFTTIQKQFRLLTAPLKQAAAMHIIQSDPTVGVSLPSSVNVKKPKRDVVSYDKEEQAKIWRAICQSRGIGAVCIGFMLETGVRVGEALALRWKDVDIARNRVKIGATVVNLMHKSKAYVQDSPKSISSNRIVPLTKQAIELLMKARALSDTEWVFENRGDRLSYAALVYQTKQICAEAGVEYHGEHVFRHTFATNCYYKGVDVKILSKILGHSDTSVTYNVYVNLYEDAFNDMYRAITS